MDSCLSRSRLLRSDTPQQGCQPPSARAAAACRSAPAPAASLACSWMVSWRMVGGGPLPITCCSRAQTCGPCAASRGSAPGAAYPALLQRAPPGLSVALLASCSHCDTLCPLPVPQETWTFTARWPAPLCTRTSTPARAPTRSPLAARRPRGPTRWPAQRGGTSRRA